MTPQAAPPAAPRPVGRFAAAGWAFVHVLLAVPTLAVFCLVTTALGLVPIGVGALLLLALVPLNAGLAQVHRAVAGTVLGEPVLTPSRRPAGRGLLGRLRAWSRDVTRWRDYAWMLVTISLGWALSWIAVGLSAAVAWYAIYPFLYAVTPAHTFDVDYGVFQVDTQARSFLEWVWLVVAGALWWWFEARLVRARARLDRALLAPSRAELEARIASVEASRSQSLDYSAAELRRVERDLHDGAQARLVALGINLGMAETLVATDPEEAARLVAEARGSVSTALGELRSVVRGILPPVLADRGLAGATEALALEMAVPVSVVIELPGRPPEPVESAVYFAVAECLANVGKHAGATRAVVTLRHDGRVLTASVRDDGRGGADATSGTGLAGIARRLAAFDGTMDVQSPAGGPTTVTLEVPCTLSSPRTTPSSATD